MKKRRRKPGRPRRPRPDGPPASGPAQASDKIAAALSCDRSGAIRWLLDLAMSGLPRALLRSGKGRGLTDAIVLATVAECGGTRWPRR